MARTLDFNTINRPVLQLTMQDDNKTVINVSTPSERLIEEFQELLPQVREIMAKKDRSSIDYAFELAAKLISANRDFIKVTADDLRTTYRMNLESLVIFMATYTDFIQDIINAKN